MTRYHYSNRIMCQSWVIGLLKAVCRRELRIACLFVAAILCVRLLQVKISPQDEGGVGGDVVKAKRDQTSPLLMVYWTTVFSKKDWGFGADLEHCLHLKNKCIFSTDRSLYRSADVMLLHMRDPFNIPKYRPPNQKWAFGIMESPVYTGLDLFQIRRLFNVTMT